MTKIRRILGMKNILSDEEFLFWCRLIVNLNKDKPISNFDTTKVTWD